MINFNCNSCDEDGNCTCLKLSKDKKELIRLNENINKINSVYAGKGNINIPFVDGAVPIKVEKQTQIEEPDYYNKGMNTSDYIDSWDLNFNLGCVVKYVTRCDHKHEDPKDDLLKAHWYLSKELKKRGWLEETSMAKKQSKKLDEFGDLLEKVHENDIERLNKEITALNKLIAVREKQYADLQERYNLATNPF